MKYYLIAGEASGDLHASRLMQALKEHDADAQFRFFGGDHMAAQGGTLVKHYRELAYMGFVPVLLHLPAIFRGMALCKRDIAQWQPHAVILVDYPGFNLGIAKYVCRLRSRAGRSSANGDASSCLPRTYYYISPKIWAWKEYRIRSIKRHVDELFSILPFEVPFFEQRHHFPIHYVGNPTASEVREFKAGYADEMGDFCNRHGLPHRPIIALLAGSRRQEIKDNLPAMLQAAAAYAADYQLVVAGAPAIEADYYKPFLANSPARLIDNDTYALLSHATAALVTSGTATLETALFRVPQVVCYKTPVPRLIRFAFNHLIHVNYISLVNLIADREVVEELLADRFSVAEIRRALAAILPGGSARHRMLNTDYPLVASRLGTLDAPQNAASIMVSLLSNATADAPTKA